MKCSIRCPNCGQEIETSQSGRGGAPQLESRALDPMDIGVPCQLGSDSADGLAAASPDPFLDMLGADEDGHDQPDSPHQKREGDSVWVLPASNSGSFLTKLPNSIRPDPASRTNAESWRPGGQASEVPSSSSRIEIAPNLQDKAGDECASKPEDLWRRDEHGVLASATPRRTVFLTSYASAVTIALIWALWNGRSRPRTDETLVPNSRIVLDRGHEQSLLAGLPELSAGSLVDLHQSLQIGELEITPLSVELGAIHLRSVEGRHREEADVLTLHLRLRHVGSGDSFAPLDRTFVREPDRGLPEALIEAGNRAILAYPLASQSEWAIKGECFEALEPGEEREILLSSEAGAGSKLAPEMIWRLRLRVSEGRTELFGFRFRLADLVRDTPDT